MPLEPLPFARVPGRAGMRHLARQAATLQEMEEPRHSNRVASVGVPLDAAEPLWRLAPTRDGAGRGLADFMLLIPRLGDQPLAVREFVGGRIRAVCADFGDRVAFADLNLSLNVLWVSVAAEPGLAGRVAQAIRAEVPDARLVGGQLGAVPLPVVAATRPGLWARLLKLRRRLALPAR